MDSSRSSLKSTLEITTNVAVLLVAVLVLTILAVNLFRKPSKAKLSLGLEKGTFFGQVSNVDYRKSDRTLIIALNANCSYCNDSVPLYQKLLAANTKSHAPIQIIGLFPNSADEASRYLKQNQLTMTAISNIDLGSLRISGTPAMVLLNNNGEVKDFWVGKLDDRNAEQLVESLLPRGELQ